MEQLLKLVKLYSLHVFPVEKGRKKPEILDWENRSTTDPEQIRKWAEAFPGCNWGVACGPSGLIVLDVDMKKGIDGSAHLGEWLKTNGELTPTLKVTTPTGGIHHYYRGVGGNRTSFLKGNDIRGIGGYVVAPLSEIGGTVYAPEEAPIAEAPAWLVDFATASGTKKENPNIPLCDLDKPENVAAAAAWLDQADPAVEGQGGDMITFRTACRIRDLGITPETCHGMMLQHWNPRCLPEWESEALWEKIQNAYRYARDRAGNQTPEGKSNIVAQMFEPVKLEVITRPYRDVGLVCPDRHWLVDGWIPQGGTAPTLFAGDGGTGKSQLALQLAVALSAGQLWLGMSTRQTASMYVSCEDDEDELDRRVFHIRKHDPILQLQDRPFWTMCRVGKPSLLAVGKDGVVRPGPFYEILDSAIGEMPEGPKAVFLDTAADMAAIDENNRVEVNALVKTILGGLGIKHHATIILIAHPSKAAGSTYSGSTAWNNAVRNRLFLRYQDPKKKTSYRMLSNEKANYAPAGGELLLQYDRGIYVPVAKTEMQGLLESAVLDVVQEAVDGGSPLSLSKQSPRYIGSVPVSGPKGELVPEEDVRSCVVEMIRNRKLRHVTGRSRGNGLFVGEEKKGWLE